MRDPVFMNRKGFTLIELLIVVAIIAILAAIAVPNFLEAQTRAKVSRTMADMRSIGVAMESYLVDNNGVTPLPGFPFGIASNYAVTHAWLYVEWTSAAYGQTHPIWTVAALTTPIAYITNYPLDPFTTKYSQKIAYQVFRTSMKASSVFYGFRWGKAQVDVHLGTSFGSPQGGSLYEDVKYYLISTGPDLWLNFWFTPSSSGANTNPEVPTVLHAIPYDPTNGTVSDGQILYIGTGVGFGK